MSPRPPPISPPALSVLRWLRRRATFGHVLVVVFLLAMLGLYGLQWEGWASTATLLIFIVGPALVLRGLGCAGPAFFLRHHRSYRFQRRRSTH